MPETGLLPRRCSRWLAFQANQTSRIVINQLTAVGPRATIRGGAGRSRRRRPCSLLPAGIGDHGGGSTRTTPRRSPARRRRWPPSTGRPTSCSPGGRDAFERRIASLRGYPVVVNVWASWCGPCRFEFPTLQKLSAKYGKRVAFLGVDSQDSDDAARTFSPRAGPLPQLQRPRRGNRRKPRRQLGFPTRPSTIATASCVYLKQGPYNEAELRDDIRRCALAGNCESG